MIILRYKEFKCQHKNLGGTQFQSMKKPVTTNNFEAKYIEKWLIGDNKVNLSPKLIFLDKFGLLSIFHLHSETSYLNLLSLRKKSQQLR